MLVLLIEVLGVQQIILAFSAWFLIGKKREMVIWQRDKNITFITSPECSSTLSFVH